MFSDWAIIGLFFSVVLPRDVIVIKCNTLTFIIRKGVVGFVFGGLAAIVIKAPQTCVVKFTWIDFFAGFSRVGLEAVVAPFRKPSFSSCHEATPISLTSS